MKKNSQNALRRSSWLNPIIALAIALALNRYLYSTVSAEILLQTRRAGAKYQTPDIRNDPKVSSPITIIPPLLRCGESVTVRGFVSGARNPYLRQRCGT